MEIKRNELINIIGETKNRQKQLKNLDQTERKTFLSMLRIFKENKEPIKIPSNFQKSLKKKVVHGELPRERSNIIVRLIKGILNRLGFRVSSKTLQEELKAAAEKLEAEETSVPTGLYLDKKWKEAINGLQKELYTLSFSDSVAHFEREEKMKNFSIRVQTMLKELQTSDEDPGVKKTVEDFVTKRILPKIELRVVNLREDRRELDKSFDSLYTEMKIVANSNGEEVLTVNNQRNLEVKPRGLASMHNKKEALLQACTILSNRLDFYFREYDQLSIKQREEIGPKFQNTIDRLITYNQEQKMPAGERPEEMKLKFFFHAYKPVLDLCNIYRNKEHEMESALRSLFSFTDEGKVVTEGDVTFETCKKYQEAFVKFDPSGLNADELEQKILKSHLSPTKNAFELMCKKLAQNANSKLNTAEAAEQFSKLKNESLPVLDQQSFQKLLKNLEWFALELEKKRETIKLYKKHDLDVARFFPEAEEEGNFVSDPRYLGKWLNSFRQTLLYTELDTTKPKREKVSDLQELQKLTQTLLKEEFIHENVKAMIGAEKEAIEALIKKYSPPAPPPR